MNTNIPNIATHDLTTETDLGPSSLTARFTGSAETDAMREVATFLKGVHEAATTAKVDEVVIDLRALEFMNSSCFKAFVSWVGTVQDTPSDAQYKVRFLSDSKKHWQSRSLSALACFAVDLIHIDAS